MCFWGKEFPFNHGYSFKKRISINNVRDRRWYNYFSSRDTQNRVINQIQQDFLFSIKKPSNIIIRDDIIELIKLSKAMVG